jgi:hypothetical protein
MRTPVVLSALLAPVASRSVIGVGGSAVGRQRFGWTSTWMDLCCLSNSFLPLFCDGGSRWGMRYGQWLACWSGAWWRKTFNFSHMLPHLFVGSFLPHEKFWSHLFYLYSVLFIPEKIGKTWWWCGSENSCPLIFLCCLIFGFFWGKPVLLGKVLLGKHFLLFKRKTHGSDINWYETN